MGIVKISDPMHENLRLASNVLIRAELAGGLDLKSLSELALNASPLETVSQADQ